jgi:hypothetical protein
MQHTNFRMDTNIYSKIDENIGDALVHWIRKVHVIKFDNTSGSGKNEQPSIEWHTDRPSIKMKRSDRLERKITIW